MYCTYCNHVLVRILRLVLSPYHLLTHGESEEDEHEHDRGYVLYSAMLVVKVDYNTWITPPSQPTQSANKARLREKILSQCTASTY